MKLELLLILGLMAGARGADGPKSWAADNGNGTYSNPLFYDEFSDPDMIRVGADYYPTAATMHAMPGLPVLHSRDLVNWKIIGYAFDRLDLGPAFRLEDGQEFTAKVVKTSPGDAETFQWVDLQRGDTLLLSLVTNRYIVAAAGPGPVAADHAGPAPDRKDGSCFEWRIVR